MKPYILHTRPIPGAKHAEDGKCPDASWKALSKIQKARLSMLAAKAYAFQNIGPAVTLAEWRREESIRACGLRISEATQAHWADLQSAFQDLAGMPGRAFATQMREGDNKRRVALHKLASELAAKGLHPSYAASICRCQYKCALEDASAKQIWCLYFTIKNRRNS